MINETIITVFFNGEYDTYPDKGLIILTDKDYYLVDTNGFQKIHRPDVTTYSIYRKHNLENHTIISAYSNGMDTFIVLSDGRMLNFSAAGDDTEFIVDDFVDDEYKNWFESVEPRETNLKKLTAKNSLYTN